MQKIIDINNGIARMPEWNMAEPVNFSLCDGEHIAIVGKNGSGKSMFVSMITGAHPLKLGQPVYDFSPSEKAYVSENIKCISFEDAYGSGVEHYYLQQRWNMHEIDAETPTVRDELEKELNIIGILSDEQKEIKKHLYNVFHIEEMLDKYVISLSSGELRKLHLTKCLLSAPRVLILDNPFIGLDRETRDFLKILLGELAKSMHIQIILVLSKIDDIPEFITHVVEVKDMKITPKTTYEEFLKNIENRRRIYNIDKTETEKIRKLVADIPYDKAQRVNGGSDEIVNLNNICIKYGKRTILKDLSWTVRSGERWALNGQNGAGKSTLLSLICADNPQSYACDIRLFGKERGSGESIWEIKKRIGYVSPEMHRAYKQNIEVIRIIASGAKDSVGLYAKPTAEEYENCKRWMKIFGIEKMKDRKFLSLSSGEQRLVLLARAFVKDSQLLILDEPFHGLDDTKREMVRTIIDTFARRKDKTIIMVSHYKDEYPSCIDHEMLLKKVVDLD